MRGRTAAALAALLLLLIGCKGGRELTLETVCKLAKEKGEALTWSDFVRYPSTETGSGLHILVYEVGDDYTLWIGGVPNETPMYIRLACAAEPEEAVDIRYGGVEEFLEKTKDKAE